jgi:hypothetical protein
VAMVGDELERAAAVLGACWASFARAADAATGVTLRTGPRGGGRSVDKMRDHVRDAEGAYIGQLGSRAPAADLDATHDAFVATLSARVNGEPLPNPRRTQKPWSPRYAVRRAAWHVLDHAWELEDRTP